jgi:hypothetical protein
MLGEQVIKGGKNSQAKKTNQKMEKKEERAAERTGTKP